MTCRFFTLTNLIADREVRPEYLSVGNPANEVRSVSQHLVDWCSDPESLQQRVQMMSDLADKATALAGERCNEAVTAVAVGHRQ